MTIKELEKKIKKQQKDINMLIELMNNACEKFDEHNKMFKSLIKNAEKDRTRIDNIEYFLEELQHHFAEGEYESENTIIH
tara:strand:- start:19 stop:258 length:240 start_codon:yes stop_codon:yes gene_type:complete